MLEVILDEFRNLLASPGPVIKSVDPANDLRASSSCIPACAAQIQRSKDCPRLPAYLRYSMIFWTITVTAKLLVALPRSLSLPLHCFAMFWSFAGKAALEVLIVAFLRL